MIETCKLILRPALPADAAELAALERDAEVMRYLGPTDLPPSAPAPFLRPRGGEPGVWTARRRADGAFVGWFALVRLEAAPQPAAELGYRLRRAAWGQGLATEGARALLAHGFESMGLVRVEATTMAVNRASRRVLEKLGFVHVATLHEPWPDPLPGSEYGEVRYALERSAGAG
jgi:RimJ/RimL family protein N-acetyltransferase